MRPLIGGAFAALLGIAAGSSQAGTIRGTVGVPDSTEASAAPNPYPGRAGSLPGRQPARRGLAGDAVVYVDHLPAAAESVLALGARLSTPHLAQRNQAFLPRVLAVAVGTRVDFPNEDPIYHNVFSLSPAKRFDLGKYPRGGSGQVVFTKPGLVNVYCDIHSDMAAFILVLPHHGFTRPAASGEFELPSLPAGRYGLKVWHPDLGERNSTVEVPATGTVTADLSF